MKFLPLMLVKLWQVSLVLSVKMVFSPALVTLRLTKDVKDFQSHINLFRYWGRGNGCKIYVDNMTGKNCQFSLLTWDSFIGQFVHPVGGKGIG